MYPWDREATPEEIAEGNALYDAGWRGVSQRYRTIALLDRTKYETWLKQEGKLDNHSSEQSYLRTRAPTKNIDYHPFRQLKRRENNWSPGVLKMIQAAFDTKKKP